MEQGVLRLRLVEDVRLKLDDYFSQKVVGCQCRLNYFSGSFLPFESISIYESRIKHFAFLNLAKHRCMK